MLVLGCDSGNFPLKIWLTCVVSLKCKLERKGLENWSNSPGRLNCVKTQMHSDLYGTGWVFVKLFLKHPKSYLFIELLIYTHVSRDESFYCLSKLCACLDIEIHVEGFWHLNAWWGSVWSKFRESCFGASKTNGNLLAQVSSYWTLPRREFRSLQLHDVHSYAACVNIFSEELVLTIGK